MANESDNFQNDLFRAERHTFMTHDEIHDETIDEIHYI